MDKMTHPCVKSPLDKDWKKGLNMENLDKAIKRFSLKHPKIKIVKMQNSYALQLTFDEIKCQIPMMAPPAIFDDEEKEINFTSDPCEYYWCLLLINRILYFRQELEKKYGKKGKRMIPKKLI